jgi:hypothetical protein
MMSRKVSPKKMLAIGALLRGLNITETSKEVHVSRRTLTRWMADPDFVAALDEAGREMIAAATRMLTTLTKPAISVIAHSMALEGFSPGVPGIRLRAAQTVLEFMLRMLDRDIDERLRKLEAEVLNEQTT